MRTPFLLLGALLVSGLGRLAVHGVEITASGISVPFYDESGRLTHKLTARQGNKAGSVQELRGVAVHYYSAADPNLVVQRLETDEATWDARAGTLTGGGRIVVVTTENRLSGEGFAFAFATSRLHVQRHFTMTNPEVELTSDRATVDLIIERAGDTLKLRDIKHCEASGHLQVVVQPTAIRKYGFEKVFSESAIYAGETKIISLPNPTRTLSHGVEMTSQSMTINLRDSTAPATPSSPR